MDWLSHIMDYIIELSSGNEMVAGALALAVSGMVGTAIAYVLKDLPNRVFNFLWTQLTTSMVLNNTDWNKNQTFIRMSTYIRENSNKHFTRNLMLDTFYDSHGNGHTLRLTVGYGLHLFFYKKRLMWVRKSKEDSSGSDIQKEQLMIHTFGRSHEAFAKLVEDLTPKVDNSKLEVYEWGDNNWRVQSRTPKLDLDRLALNPETVKELKEHMQFFLEHREDMLAKGLAHKLSMLLHGRAGNGKSTLIRALASCYDMNIALVPLARFSDESLKKAFAEVPENTMLVLEDFDSAKCIHKRDNVTGDLEADNEDKQLTIKTGTKEASLDWLTLSGVLNVLDGVVPLDKQVVIMTTNCIASIDSAVLREGRTDVTIELPEIRPEAVKAHFELLYGEMPDVEFPSLIAKDINKIKIEAKLDAEVVKRELKKFIDKRPKLVNTQNAAG